MKPVHIVGLIKTERFKKDYCKIQNSEIYGSCYYSEIFHFESVEFLIKSKFTAQKKSTLPKTQETTTLSITHSILQVLSFSLRLAVTSRYKNSRTSRLMLKPTEECVENIFTSLHSHCGMHTACLLYNGILKDCILLKITD